MHNNLNVIKLILSLFVILFLSSCLTNVETPIEEQNPTVDPCETITFSKNVKPILDSNCIQCHGNGGNFPNLLTYNSVSANATSVKAETTSRRMPQGTSLSNDEISAISCWVDAGALNN